MISLSELQQRREQLAALQLTQATDLDIYSDRCKQLRKEIANTKGAIIEIDRLIEMDE